MAKLADDCRTIGLEAVIDLSGLNTGIDSYNRSLDRMTRSTDSTVDSIGSSFSMLGSLIVNDLIVGAVDLLGNAIDAVLKKFEDFAKQSVSESSNLQQRLANIAAVFNTTLDAVAPLQAAIQELAIDPKLKVNTFQAADAIELLARNGLEMSTIMDGAARATIALSNATGSGEGSFAQAANVVTDAMNNFNLKAEDMGTLVNEVTAVVNNSKFDLNDYFLALANTGAIADSVGISFEDLNAGLIAVSSAYNTGRRAGTGFSNAILDFIPKSQEAAKYMAALGMITDQGIVKFFDAQGTFLGLENAADVLKDSLGGLSDAERDFFVRQIFGIESQESIIRLMELGGEGIRKIKAEMAKTDAFKSAETRMKTLAGSWEVFQGILEATRINFSYKALPSMQKGLDALNDVLFKNFDAMSGLGDAVTHLVEKAVDKLIPLVQVWVPRLIEASSKLTDYIVELVDTGDIFNEKFGLLPKVIQNVITFAVRATHFLSELSKTVIDLAAKIFVFLKPVYDWIKSNVKLEDVLLGAALAITAFVAPLVVATVKMIAFATLVVAAISQIRQAWETDWGNIQEFTKEVFDRVLKIIETTLIIIHDLIEIFGGDTVNGLEQAFIAIQPIIIGALAVIQKILDYTLLIIHGHWDEVWADLQKITQDALTQIQTLLASIDWDAIWANIVTFLTPYLDKAREIIVEQVTRAINEVRDIDWGAIWSKIADTLGPTMERVRTEVVSKFEELKTAALEKFEELKAKALEKFEELKADAITKFEELKTRAIAKYEELKAEAQTKIDELIAYVQPKVTAFTDYVIGEFERAKKAAQDKYGELKKQITDDWEFIKTSILTKWQAVKDEIDKTDWSGIKEKIQPLLDFIDSLGTKYETLKFRVDQVHEAFDLFMKGVDIATQPIRDWIAQNITLGDVLATIAANLIFLYAPAILASTGAVAAALLPHILLTVAILALKDEVEKEWKPKIIPFLESLWDLFKDTTAAAGDLLAILDFKNWGVIGKIADTLHFLVLTIDLVVLAFDHLTLSITRFFVWLRGADTTQLDDRLKSIGDRIHSVTEGMGVITKGSDTLFGATDQSPAFPDIAKDFSNVPDVLSDTNSLLKEIYSTPESEYGGMPLFDALDNLGKKLLETFPFLKKFTDGVTDLSKEGENSKSILDKVGEESLQNLPKALDASMQMMHSHIQAMVGDTTKDLIPLSKAFALAGTNSMEEFSKAMTGSSSAEARSNTAHFISDITFLVTAIGDGFYTAGEDGVHQYIDALADNYGIATDQAEKYAQGVLDYFNLGQLSKATEVSATTKRALVDPFTTAVAGLPFDIYVTGSDAAQSLGEGWQSEEPTSSDYFKKAFDVIGHLGDPVPPEYYSSGSDSAQSLGQGFDEGKQSVWDTVQNIIDILIGQGIALPPQFTGIGADSATSLGEGALSTAPGTYATYQDFLDAVHGKATPLPGKYETVGGDSATSLGTGVEEKKDPTLKIMEIMIGEARDKAHVLIEYLHVIGQAAAVALTLPFETDGVQFFQQHFDVLMAKIKDNMAALLLYMNDRGVAAIAELAAGMLSSSHFVTDALTTIISSVSTTSVQPFTDLGTNMGTALANGLNSQIGTVQAKAAELTNAAAAATAAAAQIASPSKVFSRLGQMSGLGYIQGLDKMLTLVQPMLQRVLNFSNLMVGQSQVLSPVAASSSLTNNYATSSTVQVQNNIGPISAGDAYGEHRLVAIIRKVVDDYVTNQ